MDCGLRVASLNNHGSCLVWTAHEHSGALKGEVLILKTTTTKLLLTKIISEIHRAFNSPWNSTGL